MQQLYFGAKINESDIDFLTKYYGDEICPKVKDFNIDLAHDIAPSECGFYARGDYKEPTLIARRVDGSFMIRFRFVYYEINDGAAVLSIMPYAHIGGEMLSISIILAKNMNKSQK